VRLRAAVGAAIAAIVVIAGLLPGALARAEENPLEPLDTSSPQATYLSFVSQVELLENLLSAYERDRSAQNQSAFTSALDKVESLFDFSEVADANQSEIVSASFSRLADILNRIPPPDVDEIPDVDDVAASESDQTIVTGSLVDGELPALVPGGITDYTLPGTEITITRIQEGSRAGEFVFSADTVSRLEAWRQEVGDLPVNDGVEVRNWVREEAEFTGHLVPRSLVDALPRTAERDLLGSPLWKFIVDVVILVVVAVFTVAWHRIVGRRGEPGTVLGYLTRLTTPTVLLLAITSARRFMDEQVNHSGDVATIVNLIITLVIWAAVGWGFRLVTGLIVEWIIATPRIPDDSIDAHLLRLLGRVIGIAGAVVLGLVGLSRVGVPTAGLGIGAGVAGLAIALAATSTLENLLGGITLYIDKPFQVGDKILISDDYGTVEAIGPRSTRIRKLDDTRVTLPNSDISRAKVINYSARHFILFVHEIGVRYETSVDQLKQIVEAIDDRFRAHPMVLDEDDYPRVRVTGFGSSSIDIEVRAHVATDDFGRFTQVQEQLLMLIYEIVVAAGTGFAFPSSTTYLTSDAGLPEPVEQ
jgi:MscS family membrane protein